jgi:hypothetical protein
MSTSRENLLADIETFLDRVKMSPTEFGRRCLGDPNLMPRLRRGSDVTLCTSDKIRAFMADYKQARPKQRSLTGAAA